MQWLVVKHAGDVSLLHVVNESCSLIASLKPQVIHVPDMVAAGGHERSQHSVLVGPRGELVMVTIPNLDTP